MGGAGLTRRGEHNWPAARKTTPSGGTPCRPTPSASPAANLYEFTIYVLLIAYSGLWYLAGEFLERNRLKIW